jgi:hypothetical protein
MTLRKLDFGEQASQTLSLNVLSGYIELDLYRAREVGGTGDPLNIAGNGGVLAADTTPVLAGATTTEEQSVLWATGNVDAIAYDVVLPPDFDGTKDVLVELIVSSGDDDDATFSVVSAWDGGALVTDTATDAVVSADKKKITATIAAADVPNTPDKLFLKLIPAAHAVDTISFYGGRVRFVRRPGLMKLAGG